METHSKNQNQRRIPKTSNNEQENAFRMLSAQMRVIVNGKNNKMAGRFKIRTSKKDEQHKEKTSNKEQKDEQRKRK